MKVLDDLLPATAPTRAFSKGQTMKVRVCIILSSLPVFSASALVAALALAGIALQVSSFPYRIYRVWHIEYLSHRGLEPTLADDGYVVRTGRRSRDRLERLPGVPPATQKQVLSCIKYLL
jgi:hypothetical protein